MAQFMYNSARSDIIGLTSFAVLYRYKLEITREARSIKIIIKKVRILII